MPESITGSSYHEFRKRSISGHAPNKTDETTVVKLAEYANERKAELTRGKNDILADFRIARELTEMQSHVTWHGAMPSKESLRAIQEKAHTEAQQLRTQIQQEQQERQREQTMRLGMRMR